MRGRCALPDTHKKTDGGQLHRVVPPETGGEISFAGSDLPLEEG